MEQKFDNVDCSMKRAHKQKYIIVFIMSHTHLE